MKRVLFIGQAMPRMKRDPHDWPTLNAWLYSIGLKHEDIISNFLYSALVDYFPGSKGSSHIVPTPTEILKERDRLKETVIMFNPAIVVPIGRLSIAYCFNEKTKPLNTYIGNSFQIDPYGFLGREVTAIPLPHPSGASTWYHNPDHKKLLQKALEQLRLAVT